jgi:oxepin-CoA hydrolase/3-oxo-5,6-dehydrosuberyl-CoA semialdehyde dehydrogenase
MRTLRSYIQDQWVEGEPPAIPLHNATTGAPFAQTSTRGLDLGAALRHAREVGGPHLRAMTFVERGALLKQMSRVVHGHRDELIDLARENSGNTRADAKFDIDGAAGTLAYYGGLGRRLGDRTFLFDGPREPILRSVRFAGQHIWVPRRGVAVHINAFNFPAWGLAEKGACALLAGMPFLSKPPTSTAVVTARVVELWAEAGILPPGVVSLLAGEPNDLLDHLGPQDVVAFTGSGDTGRLIRTHPAVVAHNLPVNVEADSLNASILGPDVEPGSDTFWMFVADVVRDLTEKAGQKCTAVRRVLVPSQSEDAVREALVERMADAPVGDPADRATRVGPLATAAQQRDIAERIAQLSTTATRIWGDPDAAPTEGFFVAPQLFRDGGGAQAAFVHDHEVFGPVATVLPWSGDPREAVDIVARGGGGLVCSVYSDDLAWAREVILGLAPWHGRIVWGSRKIHDQSFGPGTVLPNFLHGGPGRAGGGEELGGERGLRFYWQRTAIQGDRALLDKALGTPE